MRKELAEQFGRLEKRYEELGGKMAEPGVLANHVELARLGRERTRLEDAVTLFHRVQELEAQIGDAEELARSADAELAELARSELEGLRAQLEQAEAAMLKHLIPADPNEGKNAILEIRAGTGGDEAALFAGDLFRMYMRYAERRGWKTELLSSSPIGIGGFKQVVASVEGPEVWRHLRYESGVHRVQRVPVTESSGRIHTSTATVAVLPEAEEVEVQIDPKDLKIDTYRASTAGGQCVQKVETAVRITHIPTGIIASCEDERSQYQNKMKALRVLRAHILEMRQAEQRAERDKVRRTQVGTAERSEKIRTYNYPQDRITDHRLGRNFHNLPTILDGELDSIMEALDQAHTARTMEQVASGTHVPEARE